MNEAITAVGARRVAVYLIVIACLLLGEVAAQLATEVILDEKISGLGVITDIQSAGDDRLFIVARDGRIQIVDFDEQGDASVRSTPFLDISSQVKASGERGLLGLAFHPDFANNNYFFVNYIYDDNSQSEQSCSSSSTGNAKNTRISRFKVTVDPDVVDPATELVIAEIGQPYCNHNGGQLMFGPSDGFLYIPTGDGGSANDPGNRSKDLSTLLGKMLRVDIDNMDESQTVDEDNALWNIPVDNPYITDATAKDEIWSYGLRNPWRCSFDRQTRDLFVADVGQNAVEEVNFVAANGTGMENYGWRACEGTDIFNSATLPAGCIQCEDAACFVVPILEYTHSVGNSITGGYVYRGVEYSSELAGTYFYADYGTDWLWGARPDGQGGWSNEISQQNLLLSPSTFGEDKDGEIFVATFGGTLYRIKPAVLNPMPTMTPSSLPTLGPTVSNAPSIPIDYVDCPAQYEKTITLSTGLQFLYVVAVPEIQSEIDLYGGVLCGQLVYQGLGWLGFAVSQDGNMVGSEAIIGRLDIAEGPSNPGKYDLNSRNANDVTQENVRQSLINAAITATATTTTLTFEKILKEPEEIQIQAAGPNIFLWATGSPDSFGVHSDRGSFTLDFSGCNNDGTCDLGEDCISCPADCDSIETSSCGNGVCETGGQNGENCQTCSQDCVGIQSGKKKNRYCCGLDTPCSDGRCVSQGFGCNGEVPVTTQSCCGQGGCEEGETTSNCELDCPSSCVPTEQTETNCDDGIDNDCDGLVDAADELDCPSSCVPTEQPETTCDDGIDNDCDGLVDTADDDCDSGCTIQEPCSNDSDCCGTKCRSKGKNANTCAI